MEFLSLDSSNEMALTSHGCLPSGRRLPLGDYADTRDSKVEALVSDLGLEYLHTADAASEMSMTIWPAILYKT